jgi:hypothetical protein
MFEILPSPSLETILMVLRGALLVGAFWVFALAFIRWRRADEQGAQRLHAQLERAFAELRSLHETVSVMSARVESLSERTESESRLAPVGVASAQRGYDLATRLAKNGAAVEELVASCGVTRHEAELLARLHGARPREGAAAIRQQPARVEQPDTPTRPISAATTHAQAPKPAPRKRGSRGWIAHVRGQLANWPTGLLANRTIGKNEESESLWPMDQLTS